MANKDDALPVEYPYWWNQGSDTPLKEFLGKHKPSMVQNDGTKPWIWVSREEPPPAKETVDEESAEDEAKVILTEVAEKVEAIQNDDSIPVRSNKKKGTKSKKELREALQSEATENLKELSIKYGHVSGKWLIFAPSEKVDAIWSTIATSLIEGPLSSTCAYRAKVATSPLDDTPNYQHVLCLYVPDVYDKDSITEVMKVLLRQHGMNLMGVKSNLYTAIGLDSKHPSGIQSTVWKNSALMKDTEIKELKEQYFQELTSKATTKAEKATDNTAASGSSAAAPSKPKFKPKKKATADPFASDDESGEPAQPKTKKPSEDEEDEDEEFKKAALQVKKKAATTKRAATKRRKSDDDDDQDEDEDEKESKAILQPKKKAASTKRAAPKRRKTDNDEDEDEDERPKKRGGKK